MDASLKKRKPKKRSGAAAATAAAEEPPAAPAAPAAKKLRKRRGGERTLNEEEAAPEVVEYAAAVAEKSKVLGKKAKRSKSKVAEEDEEPAPAETAEPAEELAPAESKPKASKPSTFNTTTNFSKLGLSPWIVQNCDKLGMRYPTDIQAMTIPDILSKKNVAGNSKTGSGKTACYCLPILHYLSQDPFGVFALVLTPVRELAFQVSENFRALGRNINVQVLEVVGGRDMMTQSRRISERVHVIVATPGRLADLLRGDPVLAQAFSHLRTFVLDEADQLLTPTFEEPLSEIVSILPKTRQTLLFSATLTGSIEKLTSRIPGLIVKDANPDDKSLANMTQEYMFVPKTVQMCYVHYLLKEHFPDTSCIIFTPKIEICQLLLTTLEILGFPVTGLHALQTQKKRQASLGKFRAGKCSILVATDVACRGLDIPKVSVVINYGLPSFVDTFVHRSGRTARAGRPGLVVSVMTEFDVHKVAPIEEYLGRKLALREVVEDDALKVLSSTGKAQQKAELLLSEIGFEEQVADHRAARKPNRGGAGSGGVEL